MSNRFLLLTVTRCQSTTTADVDRVGSTWELSPSRPPGLYLYEQTIQPPLDRNKEWQPLVDRDINCAIDGKKYSKDQHYNIPKQILSHVGRRLYLQPNHPLCLTRELIESAFREGQGFNNCLEPHPVVTAKENFDDLGFPADHPGRSKTDTYYVNQDHVLRTHTSAHELKLFRELQHDLSTGSHGYTLCADVFRRDSVDRSHYPIFHQMEGARAWHLATAHEVLSPSERASKAGFERQRNLEAMKSDLQLLPMWRYRNGLSLYPSTLHQAALDLKAEDPNPTYDPATNPLQPSHTAEEVELVAAHLKLSVEFLIAKVFRQAQNAGIISATEPPRVRWIPTYFPFTSPSWELEVWWRDEWLEILGCGISKQELLVASGISESIAWAWGIGIERLAMLLYGIPDIRLFWSKDLRFLGQFEKGKVTSFHEFSKYPACYKDVAFWLPEDKNVNETQQSEQQSEQQHSTTPALATEEGHLPSEALSTFSVSSAAAPAGGHVSPPSEDAAKAFAGFHENDLAEIVRDVAGPLVESVTLVDDFYHEGKGRRSLCYRINYRSLERTLTNFEANQMQEEVEARLKERFGVEIR